MDLIVQPKFQKVSKIDPSDKSSTSSDVLALLSGELNTGESTTGTDPSLSSFQISLIGGRVGVGQSYVIVNEVFENLEIEHKQPENHY